MKKRTQTEIDCEMMARAEVISLKTHDPNAENFKLSGVGCVITNHNQIISESANELPQPLDLKKLPLNSNSPERYHYIEHAERNAIFKGVNTGKNFIGATIYCTRFPCSDCARAIIAVKMTRLVVNSGIERNLTHTNKWALSQQAALKMFRNASITVRYLKK